MPTQEEIRNNNKNYWGQEYGERGRLCNINCSIYLLGLVLQYNDGVKYRLCMEKCIKSKKDPLDSKHRNVTYD